LQTNGLLVITVSSDSASVGAADDDVVNQTSLRANIEGSSGWASVFYVARAILRENGSVTRNELGHGPIRAWSRQFRAEKYIT